MKYGINRIMLFPLHLAFDPSHQQIHDFLLLLFIQLNTLRNTIPPVKASSAAAGASMLRDEHRMTVHRRLLSVVWYDSRRQPLSDEVLCVEADGIHAFFPDIGFVFFFQGKTCPKFRSLKPIQCLINCLHADYLHP